MQRSSCQGQIPVSDTRILGTLFCELTLWNRVVGTHKDVLFWRSWLFDVKEQLRTTNYKDARHELQNKYHDAEVTLCDAKNPVEHLNQTTMLELTDLSHLQDVSSLKNITGRSWKRSNEL